MKRTMKPEYIPFLNFIDVCPCLAANMQQIARIPNMYPMMKPMMSSTNVPSYGLLMLDWSSRSSMPILGPNMCPYLNELGFRTRCGALGSSSTYKPDGGTRCYGFSCSANSLIVLMVSKYSLSFSISASVQLTNLYLIYVMFLLSPGLKCVPRRFRSISSRSCYRRLLLLLLGAWLFDSKFR